LVFIDHPLNLVLNEEVNYTLHILRGRYAAAPFWVHFIDKRGFENLLLLLNVAGWLLRLYYDLRLFILFVVVIFLILLAILLGMLKERLLSCSVVVSALHVRL
jgi:hypothetical protein